MKLNVRRLLVSCALFAVVALTPGARAQEGDDFMMDAGPIGIPMTWRQVDQGATLIGFDADQVGSAKTLHQGYKASIKAARDKVKRGQEALRKKQEEKPDQDYQVYWKEYAKLTDSIEFSLPPGGLLDPLIGWAVKLQLRRMFAARHTTTKK